MKAEFTSKIMIVGNSNGIIIPKLQVDILKVKPGDVVKVTVEKIKAPKE